MLRHSLHCLFASAALLLSACGGGGDSAGVPPDTTYNAAAAWQNLLTTNFSYTVNGVASDGSSYELSLSSAPASAAAFPVTGVTAYRTSINSTLRRNGVTLVNGLQDIFFDANFLQIGSRTAIPGEAPVCDAGISAGLPSAAALTGQSGPLSVSDELDGCDATSNTQGTTTETWSIEFYDGRSYFCTNATERDLATPSNVISTEQDCIEIAPNGSLGTHARVTPAANGITLLAKN